MSVPSGLLAGCTEAALSTLNSTPNNWVIFKTANVETVRPIEVLVNGGPISPPSGQVAVKDSITGISSYTDSSEVVIVLPPAPKFAAAWGPALQLNVKLGA